MSKQTNVTTLGIKTKIEPTYLTLKGFVENRKISSIQFLLHILSYRRKARTVMEEVFVDELKELIDSLGQESFFDDYDNLLVSVGDNYDTLFSCHTDQIDPLQSKNTLDFKPLTVYSGKEFLNVRSGIKSQLGADDAVGVWIMLSMIEAKIPGLYVFHREEEIGGHGSTEACKILGAVGAFNYLKKAVAFDRKGTGSVISHQGMGRTASDKFCQALADSLNAASNNVLKLDIDDTGVFTDTCNYADDICECTNISAGYYLEHTFEEWLDLDYAANLLYACLKVDWTGLPVDREPGDYDYVAGNWASYYKDTTPKYGSVAGIEDYQDDYLGRYDPVGSSSGSLSGSNHYKLMSYIKDNPAVIAEYLEFSGIGIKELEAFAGDF